MQVQFDPVFAEEAVFLETKAREAADEEPFIRMFRAEWDAVYEMTGEDREQRFQEIAARCFEKWGLKALVMDRFAEFPLVEAGVPCAFVRRAWSRKEERIELFARDSSKTLGMFLQAGRALRREEFIAFLRQELMHVSDMLDPVFGYDLHPELGGSCEPEDDLIRGRFRALWDVFVDGRMRRQSWKTCVGETQRRREFEQAFSAWGPTRRQTVFAQVFSRDRLTQGELLCWAKETAFTQPLGRGGVRCPLCHFPTRNGIRTWKKGWADVVEAIRIDFPRWTPSQGACLQCAELYRSQLRRAG